jgi:uncharacterized protein (DUF58 family)
VGLVQFRNAETGETQWVDTSDRAVRKNYEINWRKQDDAIKNAMARSGVDLAVLRTDRSWIQPLSSLLKRRGAK